MNKTELFKLELQYVSKSVSHDSENVSCQMTHLISEIPAFTSPSVVKHHTTHVHKKQVRDH